jgi:hypothetical protein
MLPLQFLLLIFIAVIFANVPPDTPEHDIGENPHSDHCKKDTKYCHTPNKQRKPIT